MLLFSLLQNYHYAYCYSERREKGIVFRSLITGYITIIFLLAIFLSLFITRIPQSIKTDLSLTRAAAVIGTITFVAASLVEAIASDYNPQLVWWCYAIDAILGYTVMMGLIIIYQVRYVLFVRAADEVVYDYTDVDVLCVCELISNWKGPYILL